MRLASLTVSVVCSLGLLAVAVTSAEANTPAVRVGDVAIAAATAAAATAPERNIVLAAKAKIDAKKAAAIVKQKFGAKVLSVKLIASKGPPVYRVKTLSKSGVVKVVFVDGQSGKVFD
ncbi:MAG: PepSY domain-containing protein [Pseudomonadales bacterium]|nr:PepSY domain-containing protein [Pseudomonadales bacterium]MDP7358955.1 PepSY domain-containing protein [Pseudomonadales bacterium]MDP7595798.1 PepSY domain-containing protein [Pseudomonadales bacterium]HJN48915.1 PepSY domain-containing protein [Pseudomonadales bacterium]